MYPYGVISIEEVHTEKKGKKKQKNIIRVIFMMIQQPTTFCLYRQTVRVIREYKNIILWLYNFSVACCRLLAFFFSLTKSTTLIHNILMFCVFLFVFCTTVNLIEGHIIMIIKSV